MRPDSHRGSRHSLLFFFALAFGFAVRAFARPCYVRYRTELGRIQGLGFLDEPEAHQCSMSFSWLTGMT